VSADRFKGARWLLDHFKIDVILLDDGFQHLRLHRDFNVLLIDAMNPIGNGYLLPRGALREPLTEVRRADVVVFTRYENGSDRAEWINEIERFGRPCLRSAFRPSALIHLGTGSVHPPSALAEGTVLSFCGIGNPDSFARLLDGLGARVEERICFGDHYAYQFSDFEKIRERAKGIGAKWVVTTEKDAVKIKSWIPPDFDVWALQVEVVFWDDPQKWESLLLGNVKR
ncbi:MAG TPA: tetraacyldisaccharide 4'-kinase, partial [Candidatus Manganitrophaceae bacterium]